MHSYSLQEAMNSGRSILGDGGQANIGQANTADLNEG